MAIAMVMRWTRFFRLDTSDQIAHVSAWALLWIVRVTQWIFPYPLWRRMGIAMCRVDESKRFSHAAEPATLKAVAWRTKRMSRLVPRVNCLTQAVVVRHLLARRGIETRMNIGIQRQPNGTLDAHAWVTALDPHGDDTLVIGGKVNLRRYTLLERAETH